MYHINIIQQKEEEEERVLSRGRYRLSFLCDCLTSACTRGF